MHRYNSATIKRNYKITSTNELFSSEQAKNPFSSFIKEILDGEKVRMYMNIKNVKTIYVEQKREGENFPRWN